MPAVNKADYIKDAIKHFCNQSDFNTADLSDICRLCLHAGIQRNEVEQYIASLCARGLASSNIVGRAYYVTLKS